MKLCAALLLMGLLMSCRYESNTSSIHIDGLTLGQQLMDLKSAYDSGAVSKLERDKVQENLLASSLGADNLLTNNIVAVQRLCASENGATDKLVWSFVVND